MIQRATTLLPVVKLGGVENAVAEPTLKFRTWLDGTFQQLYGPWFTRKTKLRGFAIRTANQVRFSLFREYAGKGSDDVVIGRDGWFFIRGYVTAANGLRMPEDEVFLRVAKSVRALQDALDRRGVPFFVVIAPNKVDVYPEFMPPHLFRSGQEERGNAYTRFLALLEGEGVRILDLHAWFRDNRDKGTHPYFTKGGIHWSHYGSAVAGRLILDRLEAEMKRPIAKYRVADVRVDETPVGLDKDVIDLMNIWWPERYIGPQIHPVLAPEMPDGAERPDVLIVGDSFTWGLHPHFNETKVFSRRDTLFYFQRRMSWPSGGNRPLDMKKFDWEKEVFSRDAVILLYSARNLPGVDRGFCSGAAAYDAKQRAGGTP